MKLAILFLAQIQNASPTPPITLDFNVVEAVLQVLAGAIAGPFVTMFLKRLTFVDEQLGGAINAMVTLALYVGAWWIVTGGDGAQLGAYLMLALAAAGVGGAANNVWRKRLMDRS